MTSALKMEVERRESESKAILWVGGYFDICTADQVKDGLQTLSKEGVRVVELNLSQLIHLDSTGLAALLKAWSESRRQGRSLTIVEASSRVRRVLAAVRLEFLLDGEPQPPLRHGGHARGS